MRALLFVVLAALVAFATPSVATESHKMCNTACNTSYIHAAHLGNSCIRGCRLFGMIYLSHDKSLEGSELSGMCKKSCKKGFSSKLGGADARKACKRGCENQEKVFRENKVGVTTAVKSVVHDLVKLPELHSLVPDHQRIFGLMQNVHKQMLNAMKNSAGVAVQRVQIRIHSLPTGKDGKPRYQVQIHQYPMMSLAGRFNHHWRGQHMNGYMRGIGPMGGPMGGHMGGHMGGPMRGWMGMGMDDDMWKMMESHMGKEFTKQMKEFSGGDMWKVMESHMGKEWTKKMKEFSGGDMWKVMESHMGKQWTDAMRKVATGDDKQVRVHQELVPGDEGRRHGYGRHGDKAHRYEWRGHGMSHDDMDGLHREGVFVRVRHFFRNMNEPAKAGLRWSLCGLLILSVVGLLWLCCTAFRSATRPRGSVSLGRAFEKKASVQSGDIFYVDVAKKPLMEDDELEKAAKDEA